MKTGEDAMPWLGLEVKDATDRPVVLPHRLVKVDPSHLSLGEVDGAEIGDAALLVAVHPDLLADHQHVRVLVEDNLGGALSHEAGLGHPPSLKLRRVNILGLSPRRGSSSFRRHSEA